MEPCLAHSRSHGSPTMSNELGLYLLAISSLLTSAMAAAAALAAIRTLYVLRNQRSDGIRLSALTIWLDQNWGVKLTAYPATSRRRFCLSSK